MRPTLDLSELVTDPEFLSDIVRYRPVGGFVAGLEGRYRNTHTPTELTAIVQPTSNPDKTTPMPEGERMDGWIEIYSAQSLFMVGAANDSDVVGWNGGKYRVMKVERYEAYGYYVAYAQEYHAATPTRIST
jgi:hypothetical protein